MSESYGCDVEETADHHVKIEVTKCPPYEWAFEAYSRCQMDERLVNSEVHPNKVYFDYTNEYFNKHGDTYISLHEYSQDRHICITNPLQCHAGHSVLPCKFCNVGLCLF